MLWITIFVAFVLALAVILYVVRPLLDRTPTPVFVDDDRLTDLLSRKDATLRAIKDLEFDYQVGKVSEEDFERFNQTLSRQAIGLIQQIEKLAPETSQMDDALEAEIARKRKALKTPAARPLPAANTKPVAKPSLAKAAVVPAKALFCTACGAPLENNFKFCANCGAIVAVNAQKTPG